MGKDKYKTCCLFNVAAHYRAPIYKLMDKELNCDFFIGDEVLTPLKKMRYNELSGFKEELKNIHFGHMIWQRYAIKIIFKGYENYIITGEPACLTTWIILILARFTSKKTFLWTHGWYGRENKKKKFIKKLFYGLSTGVLLYGDYARDLMIREGYKPEKLHCIYNSLDYDLQIKIRKSLIKTDIFNNYFSNSNPVLCYVGRVQKIKKIDMIIESMIILKEKYNKCVNLVIVGEEIESTNIAELIRKNNLIDNVWLYGQCYEEEKLSEIFYNASLCISPGHVGLTAIHALTYGCPVITHDNFCNQAPEFEVINPGITGYFFEEGNTNDLALKIYNWLVFSPVNTNKIRNECYKVIDNRYNPHYQIALLKSVLTLN